MFRRTESGLVDGRRALEQAIHAGLSGGNDPVTATRLWLGMRPEVDVNNDAEQTQQEMEEEEGFLDTLASSEAEISNLGQVVHQVIDPLNSISELFVSSTQNLKTSDASGGGFGGRLAIANRLATGLNQQADELSPIVDEYERKMRRIAPGIDLLLGRIAETKESGQGINDFIEQMLFFSNSVHGSVSTTKDFETMLIGIGANSKDLRRVTTRISKILARFRDASSPAVNWRTRLTNLKELANGPATNSAEIAHEE
jgi:ABC-type transporter Mla subunit MlaD